jgi:hypothetical protein
VKKWRTAVIQQLLDQASDQHKRSSCFWCRLFLQGSIIWHWVVNQLCWVFCAVISLGSLGWFSV